MNKLLIFIMSSLFLGCGNHKPFLNKADKIEAKKLLNKNIKLSNKEYNFIRKDDSLLYSLRLSIKKDNVPNKLIRRRLDSFFLNSYSRKKLLAALEIERVINDEYTTFEFRKGSPEGLPEFNTAEEFETYMKEMESIFNSQIKNSKSNLRENVKKDSI